MRLSPDLVNLLADHLARCWDRYGAPGAARLEDGTWVASYKLGGRIHVTEAPSQRQALLNARREWFRALLQYLRQPQEEDLL